CALPISIGFNNPPVEVARLFCIGRDYAAHAAELGNAVGEEPVVFMKPPTAIVPPSRPIRLPRDRGPVHHEAEIVLLVGRDGADSAKDISGMASGLAPTRRS